MDPLYESILSKIWVPQQQWAVRVPRPTAQELKDEVYKFYHGEDQAAPAPTSTAAAYDACVTQLVNKVTRPEYYQKESHDHVFTNPKQGGGGAEEWRVYVNIHAGDLCLVGNYIMDVLFLQPSVNGFKVARSPQEADHFADPLVIYCDSQNAAENAARTLQGSPLVSGALRGQRLPEMTRRTQDGVGYGQSPRDYKVSFGAIRAAAIAKGILAYWGSGGAGNTAEDRSFLSFCVERSLASFGLDPNNAHRNAGDQGAKIDVAAILKAPLKL